MHGPDGQDVKSRTTGAVGNDQEPGLSVVLIALALLICAAALMSMDRSVIRDRVTSTDGRLQMRIDINAASEADLLLLPGIGPRLAERIVEDRRERGRFSSLTDLARVPGIGPITIERIAPLVAIESGISQDHPAGPGQLRPGGRTAAPPSAESPSGHEQGG